jgi:hypothetical protein
MATYITNDIIIANGYENALTIPYKGKVLEKTFPKGIKINGIENNSMGQKIILVDENTATNTIDKDTKIPYKGKAQFALDPNKLIIVGAIEPSFKTNGRLSEEGKKAKQKSLIMTSAKILAVSTALYAFSKYKGYDSGKTAKVTIIGSVLIIGAVVANGFSGAWDGTTFMESIFGKKKSVIPTPKNP